MMDKGATFFITYIDRFYSLYFIEIGVLLKCCKIFCDKRFYFSIKEI